MKVQFGFWYSSPFPLPPPPPILDLSPPTVPSLEFLQFFVSYLSGGGLGWDGAVGITLNFNCGKDEVCSKGSGMGRFKLALYSITFFILGSSGINAEYFFFFFFFLLPLVLSFISFPLSPSTFPSLEFLQFFHPRMDGGLGWVGT
eukprot:TRINITY_DN4442_c0_g1_i9.p4 TRINITY_DN4442_c0_g1~~TRINITY_DN4442_c0_g1_i9.p4  ORF type:complete len:145 (+),score=31.25 TRINITY_DN4442_c0_g1_i9:1079-1513(+)